MVSEAQFDANQKKFRETLAQSQTTQPLGLPIPGSPTSTIPATDEFGNPVQLPAGTGGIQNFAADPLAAGLMIGGGGPGLGVRGGAGMAQKVGQQLTATIDKKLVAILSLSTVLNAAVAAFMSGPNSIIGKEANKFYSDLGIDVGNMRLLAFEQMYTTPVEDPKTGQWTFLFDDETQLVDRMRENGITKDLIPKRVIQLQQLRTANLEFVVAAGGSPEELRAAGQLQTGELPFAAAQRIAKEKTAANAVGNAQGLTVAQIGQVNSEFEGGVRSAEVEKQKQESLQKAPPTVAELTQLPPGQLQPSEMEKVIKAKTPNQEVKPATLAAPKTDPRGTFTPAAGAFTPAGGCPPGYIWDAGQRKCVRDTGVSRL